ncbi:hypothetical protein V495_00742 [Pseudogymnoascus sp. VKM F-4514 (FW-929)]|nr:hypothetical protein V495_00742 [Pseudogymnoascus sp. VKM F-4514 (FW-929)]KFY55426.1 hypothetical protein V497_06980 [Pseudogymnoascus sp. VKM F-4516 (FW-969)]
MEQSSSTNPAFVEAKKALAPYIKSRQEVAHIRRVLALHLKSQVDDKGDAKLPAPISLACESANKLPTTSGAHGLRREYLRALKANVKARQEYAKLTTESQATKEKNVEEISLGPYLALEKQKQKLERLQILQKYVDSLAIKTPAFASFLEQPSASIEALPQLPTEAIASAARSGSESSTVNLEDLIQDLERDVLRAKLLLKSEQDLLAKIQGEQKKQLRRKSSSKAAEPDQTLKALEKTRNELIGWVEEELGKAGDAEDQPENPSKTRDSEVPIEHAVNEVREKYARYLRERKGLLEALARPAVPDITPKPEVSDVSEESQNTGEVSETAGFITPYLSELLAISREQKSLSQQRSHITTSLAKQNKETIQVFDRLAEESHLLPKYQLPQKRARKGTGTFADEMAVKESPGVSHRAEEWTYAAQASSIDTMEAVCVNVDEGKTAIEEAKKALDRLDKMLGYSTRKTAKGDDSGGDIWLQEAESGGAKDENTNIWSTLDGQLGVL